MKQQNIQGPPQKSSAKKYLLIGLGVAAVGTGAFFGWRYFKNQKEKKRLLEDNEPIPYTPTAQTPGVQTSYTPSYTPKPQSDTFPLKKGSRGEKVRQLQNALISRYGTSVLPRYGADGDFGSEMVAALKSNGWPESIDENTFNVITSSSSTSIDASDLASKLYSAVIGKSYSDALSALKQMKSVSDYKDVNEKFKTYSIGGVSYTLVNALLTKFTDGTQKEQFRKEFLRMGLKYDGSKWSLSGLIQGTFIITLHPTVVWDYPNKRISVAENTVLGRTIESKKGYTLFETMDGKHKLIVKTNSVKIHNEN